MIVKISRNTTDPDAMWAVYDRTHVIDRLVPRKTFPPDLVSEMRMIAVTFWHARIEPDNSLRFLRPAPTQAW